MNDYETDHKLAIRKSKKDSAWQWRRLNSHQAWLIGPGKYFYGNRARILARNSWILLIENQTIILVDFYKIFNKKRFFYDWED